MKQNNRIREGSRLADVIIYTVAAIAAFITLYPLYYVLILSLSKPEAAATMRVYWLPKGFYLGGYERIFSDTRLWTWRLKPARSWSPAARRRAANGTTTKSIS